MRGREFQIGEDCFDGLGRLRALLDPQKSVKRAPLVDTFESRPVDETDRKLVGFLQGKKVYFKEEELEEYIIGLPSLEDILPAMGDSLKQTSG